MPSRFSSDIHAGTAVLGSIVCSFIIFAAWTFPFCLEPVHFLIGHPGDSIMTLDRWENWRLGVKYVERPLLNLAGAYLTNFIDPIITYNLLVVISFPLTALTAFALFHWVTGHAFASMVSALFFAFSPYHWAHSLGHLYLAHIQWIPLAVLSLGLFISKPSFRNSALLIVSLAFLTGTSYYYAFFFMLILVFLFPFAVAAFISKGYGRKMALSAVIAIALVIISLPLTRSYLSWLWNRPAPRIMLVEDMFRYTARLREYVMPGGISAVRRIWSPALATGSLHASNEVEQSIFIGWIPILLSSIALISSLRKRRIRINTTALVWICTGGMVALVLSAPPVVSMGSLQVHTPNYFITRVIPFFRSYVRMAVFVQLAVYLVAAVGLIRLMQTNRKWAVLAGILGILEFTPIPPPRILRLLPERPVHSWAFANTSDQDMIEFPFMSRRTPRANRRMFFNSIHRRFSVEEISTLDVRHVSYIRDNTCRELKRAGVGFAIFHHDPPEPRLLVYKDRVERDPSVLRPWPRIQTRSRMKLVAHHPGSLSCTVHSPSTPLEFGIRYGAGRWEEGRHLIGRQLIAHNEFGVRSRSFRPVRADISLSIGHGMPHPAEWRVHVNGDLVETVPVERDIVTIVLSDIEMLPDLNEIELIAHDEIGARYSHAGTTPAGFLRKVHIDP